MFAQNSLFGSKSFFGSESSFGIQEYSGPAGLAKKASEPQKEF
jgi:hypothetical protein